MLHLFSAPILAQDAEMSRLEVVGEAKEATGEIIADRDANRDVNGVLTAGLRIVSDMTGFSFESNNGILKIQQQPGANLLYLSPNERVINIYRDGFAPFQLILASHGISLESGKVWEIQLTGDRKIEEAAARVSVSPENAIVTIDGEEHTLNGTELDIKLAEGEHVLQIQKDSYNMIIDTVNVAIDAVNIFSYKLEEIDPIFLRIASNPSSASVYLNDDPGSKGSTPIRIPVYPGNHTIRLELDGYVRMVDELQINEEVNELSYNLTEYAGYLTVKTTPPHAGILIDGEVIAQRENIKLVPGLHQLQVTASGFDAQQKNIEIPLGDTLVENINLNMVTGDLIFSIMQPEAKITLSRDNKVVQEWQGSKRIANLPTGKYTLRASLANFQTETRDIEILRDEDETLNFNLMQIYGQGTFNINGVFDDAEVEIVGTRFRRTYDSMPISIESLPFGAYDVEVSKDGFQTYKTRINFNSFQQDLILVDEFVPKTKGKALFRSLFIPGLGHGYLDKGGRGFLYFLGSAAALGFTYKAYTDYNAHYESYSTNLQLYKDALSNHDMHYSAYLADYDAAKASLDQVRLGLTIFAAIKGLETLDLLFQKSNRRILKKAKLGFNPDNAGLSMKVNF